MNKRNINWQNSFFQIAVISPAAIIWFSKTKPSVFIADAEELLIRWRFFGNITKITFYYYNYHYFFQT